MAGQSKLEQLPPEIIYIILSYLTYPRSRLPGLTEQQSAHDYPESWRRAAKDAYHMNNTAIDNVERFAANLFAWPQYQHPLNTLALVSEPIRACVEYFCAALVKRCNRFNLPISQSEELGPDSVYPSLSGIVYRRLWLQSADRYCVFCTTLLSVYPHQHGVGLLSCCRNCFYAQVYTHNEVAQQFHMSLTDLTVHQVRGTPTYVLRVDVDALAMRLYGTKRYHDIRGTRGFCDRCSQAGTLQRIARQREEQRSQFWVPVHGTDGWVATPTVQLPTNRRWPRYINYRRDLYLYRDDDGPGGYHLGSRLLL
ncbi:hypothetical protein M011DRAFT_404154 [Sporormia fimetaria CBS 119925]|uniref:Uncharacterized protein n=1 Tax=Sporormia fimetaria CBS 119925 TaxID=1340428 RepID=A0A6A6V7Q5_9PLEO|nr:hypothetical protein M011DRAFT_404154 [Sporormia fimetaria CBS 119925]